MAANSNIWSGGLFNDRRSLKPLFYYSIGTYSRISSFYEVNTHKIISNKSVQLHKFVLFICLLMLSNVAKIERALVNIKN